MVKKWSCQFEVIGVRQDGWGEHGRAFTIFSLFLHPSLMILPRYAIQVGQREHQSYISYLPLAYIYEWANQVLIVHYGAAFYQGDHLKLLEDMSVLRPAIFCSVPRLYNKIYAGFCNSSLHIHVCFLQAYKGMRNIYAAKIMMVPIKEMTDVLSVESKAVDLCRDTWIRMKTGTYKGDLAKIVDVDNVRQKVTVKLIPRIDLQALENKLEGREVQKKKAFTPPPRFMNIDEARIAVAAYNN